MKEFSDYAIDAAARVIMQRTFNYNYDGLDDDRIRQPLKPTCYSQFGGPQWQGGKEDMRDIARAAIAAALQTEQK